MRSPNESKSHYSPQKRDYYSPVERRSEERSFTTSGGSR